MLPRTLTQVADSGFVAASFLHPRGPASPLTIPHLCESIITVYFINQTMGNRNKKINRTLAK